VNRLKLVIFLLAITNLLAGTTEAKEICLTFERLPSLKPYGFWIPREISNMILRSLERNDILAAGFVQEEKIDDDIPSFVVLQDWVERGHTLGNNTYSYVDLNELSSDDFIEHVADGQKYIRRVTRPTRGNYRYLRFPQLHEGNTKGKKKDVAKRLYRADYVIVPATVIPSDYNFNRVYVETKQGSEEMDRLKEIYLQHIAESLDYAENQAEKVLGGPITHILRLHMGIATASFIDDLISLLKERGYSFVSLDEALADPAYKEEEEYVGPLGLSFIDRIAATRGLPYDADHARLSIGRIRSQVAASAK
jgi:peptidoglycan/xylan/chitin deacetylase (PgdA/CDA1 family)